MTWVSKEYEIKTKMEPEWWTQLKMLFLLGYNLKIVIECEGEGGGVLKNLVCGGWVNFRLVGGTPFPTVEKTLY